MAEQLVQDPPGTVADLGRKVKEKYPEYKDLPDDEVGRRVKEKYPDAYGSFTDLPGKPVAPPPQMPPAMAGGGGAASAGLQRPSTPAGMRPATAPVPPTTSAPATEADVRAQQVFETEFAPTPFKWESDATRRVAENAAQPRVFAAPPPVAQEGVPQVDPRWEKVVSDYRASGGTVPSGDMTPAEEASFRQKALGHQVELLTKRKADFQSGAHDAGAAGLGEKEQRLHELQLDLAALQQQYPNGAPPEVLAAAQQKYTEAQALEADVTARKAPFEAEAAELDAAAKYLSERMVDAENRMAQDPDVQHRAALQRKADARWEQAQKAVADGNLFDPVVMEQYFQAPVAHAVMAAGGSTGATLSRLAAHTVPEGRGEEQWTAVADWFSNGMRNLDARKPQELKKSLLGDDWSVNEGWLPKFVEGATQMGFLAVGGTAGAPGMVATAMLTAGDDYYREGLDSGMTPDEAEAFSLSMSGAEAAVELANPGPFFNRSIRGSLAKQALKAIKDGAPASKASALAIGGYMAKQAGAEGLEENLTSFVQNGMRNAANDLTGADLEVGMTLKGEAENFIMGAVLGGLMGAGRIGQRPMSKQAIQWGVEHPQEFTAWVQKNVPEAQREEVMEKFDRYQRVYKGLPPAMPKEAAATIAAAVVEKERIKEEQASSIVDETVAAITGNQYEQQLEAQDELIAQANGTTLADVIKRQEIAKLQDQYDKAKLKSEITGTPMAEGAVRPKDPEPLQTAEGSAVTQPEVAPTEVVVEPTVVEDASSDISQQDGTGVGVEQPGIPETLQAPAPPLPQAEASVPVQEPEVASTPVRDAFNAEVEALDATNKRTDTENIAVGDYISIPQSDKSSGLTGIVRKVGPKNIEVETTYGGYADSDVTLMTIKAKKADVKAFVSKKQEAAPKPKKEKPVVPEAPKPKKEIVGREEKVGDELQKALKKFKYNLERVVVFDYNGHTRYNRTDALTGNFLGESDNFGGARSVNLPFLDSSKPRKTEYRIRNPKTGSTAGFDTLADVEAHFDIKPAAAKQTAIPEVPSKADIIRELDEIAARAIERRDKAFKDAPDVSMAQGGSEIDYMTPEERARRYELIQQLPSVGEEARAAQERLKERAASRKKAPAKAEAPAPKKEKAPATPSYKRADAKPVAKPTVLKDTPTEKEYAISGMEEYRTVVVKTPKGWQVFIKAPGLDAEVTPTAHPTPDIAIGDAAERMRRAGKAKLDGILDAALEENEAEATEEVDEIDEALKKLKFHKPGQLSAGTPLTLAWDAAIDIVRLARKGGLKLADAVERGIEHLKSTEWWKSITEKEQKAHEQDFRDALTSVAKVNPKQRTITVNERTALKDQIRLEARAAREAKGDVRAKQKVFAQSVKTMLKEDLFGRLTPKQATSIATRAASTNPDNQRAVDRFFDYATRVIENANYAEALLAAKDARNKARVLAKDKSIPANLKEVLKRIAATDIGMLNDPLEFAGEVEEFLRSFKRVASDAYAMGSTETINKYLDGVDKQVAKAYADMVKDEFDIDASGVDAEALYEALMEGEGDAFIGNLDDEKKKAVHDAMVRLASYSKMGLADVDASGMTVVDKAIVKSLEDVDLSRLSTQQLADYVFYVDNLATNGSFDGIERVVAIARAEKRATETGGVTAGGALRSDWSGFLKKPRELFRAMFYGAPNALVRIAGFTHDMGRLANSLGINDLGKAKTSVDRVVRDEGQKLHEFIDEQTKKGRARGVDINAPKNRLSEGVVGFMLQRIPGLTDQGSFEGRKNILRQDIERSSKYPELKAEYDSVAEFYNLFVKDATSQAELMAAYRKAFPENARILEWMKGLNERYQGEVISHNRRFRNQADEAMPDYLTTTYTHAPDATKAEVENALPGGEQKGYERIASGIPKPYQSKKLKGRTGATNLRPRMRIDYNLRRNTMRALGENLYDARTSREWMAIRELLNMPEAPDILGGEKNVTFLKNMLADMYEAQVRIGVKSGAIEKNADRLATWGKRVASFLGLAGFTQVIQQASDQVTNAFVMSSLAGTNPKEFGKTMVDAARAKQSGLNDLLAMGSIGERGELLAGTKWSSELEAEISRLEAGINGNATIEWLKDGYEKLNKLWFTPLRSSDVFSATVAWTSYYKQALEDAGEKAGKWSNEAAKVMDGDKVRNDAFAYAEMMTALTQGPSDPSMFPEWARKGKSGVLNLVKTVVNPFGSFSATMRGRLVQAATEAWRYRNIPTEDPTRAKEKERFDSAMRVLASSAASNAAFEYTRFVIVKAIISAGAAGLSNLITAIFGDDDDETVMEHMAFVSEIMNVFRIMDRDMNRIVNEADRDMRAKASPAYDEQRDKERRAAENMKMALTSYAVGMTISGGAQMLDEQTVDAFNRAFYYSAVMSDDPAVRKRDGSLIPFDTWKKDTKNTPLVRGGQWKDAAQWGVFSVLTDRADRIKTKYDRLTDENRVVDATQGKYQVRDANRELSQVISGFVDRRDKAATQPEKLAVDKEAAAWREQQNPNDRKRLWDAYVQGTRKEGVDPWYFVVKGIGSPEVKARAVYNEWRPASEQERTAMFKTIGTVKGIRSERFDAEFARLRKELGDGPK